MKSRAGLVLFPLVAVLVACGGADTDGGARPERDPPYSQEATGECLEQAGYELAYEHGDPGPGEGPEVTEWSLLVLDVGMTSIDFVHPSREPPDDAGGERHGNAVVRIDVDAADDADRDAILACLR